MSLEAEVKFGFEFLSQLNASEESMIYSPASLLQVLAMIYAGAKENTAKQIAQVIGSKDKKETKIIEFYSEFVKRHQEDKDAAAEASSHKILSRLQPGGSVSVNITNKIFINDDTDVLPTYKKLMEDKFNNEIQKINFANKNAAAKEINEFISKATNNIINDIISSDDVGSQTKAAIINAVNFNGFWEKPFHQRRKMKFFSNPPRKIDMMQTSPVVGNWNFREGKTRTSLGIPYKTRKSWMFIVMPRERDGLAALLKEMDFEMFQSITKRQTSGKIGITIPIIETTTSLNLPEYLCKMGITDLFDCKKCDLSKMFLNSQSIGKALQKCVIKIDERGTEATAANIAFKQAVSSPGFFAAEHPFLYFIISNENPKSIVPKDILFIGTFC